MFPAGYARLWVDEAGCYFDWSALLWNSQLGSAPVGAEVDGGEIWEFSCCVGGIDNHTPNKETKKKKRRFDDFAASADGWISC